MRHASFQDAQGRKWAVLLPEGVPDEEASMGVHLGPPSLESLGLPEDVEIRLHNQLFERRLLTLADVKARRQHVFGALQATFGVDTGRIVALFKEEGKDGKKQKAAVGATKKTQRRKTPRR